MNNTNTKEEEKKEGKEEGGKVEKQDNNGYLHSLSFFLSFVSFSNVFCLFFIYF